MGCVKLSQGTKEVFALSDGNPTIYKCRLCGKQCSEKEISEEHYPAKSVGNNDIVKLDIVKMIDNLQTAQFGNAIKEGLDNGKTLEEITDTIFDKELSTPLYPKGRTGKTLCQTCNTFLGKYDEAYLKFYKVDGNPSQIKGFQQCTKIQIIKAIYAKFLSVPEALDENFDFVNFIKDDKSNEYNGIWKLYFVKRSLSSDILGLKDIRTGKATFNEGVVYELSDDKFIFNILNFEKHSCYEMTNIFDILNKDYQLTIGTGSNGGYHSSILMGQLFSGMEF